MADLGHEKRIYLIGLMGSGKTTIGGQLAQSLDWQFTDLDRSIEILAGQTIPQIFEKQGESKFRVLESEALKQTAELVKHVIACGGGVTTTRENVEFLRQETTIWLEVNPDTAAKRLKSDHQRPLLHDVDEPAQRLEQLLNERLEAYGHAAEFRVDTNHVDPVGVAAEILELLESEHD